MSIPVVETQDLQTQLIHKNSCGKCRAAKRAVCVCKPMQDAAEEEIELEEQQQQRRIQDTIEAKILEEDHQSKEKSDSLPDMRIPQDGLRIDDNRQLGRLSLTFLFKSGALELKRYVDSILKELEEFKKEHGITVNCVYFEKDSAGNLLSLRIILPQMYLYEAFMARLANKNILAMQNFNNKENTAAPAQPNRYGLFSPLSTSLTLNLYPFNKKKTREEEERERQARLLPNPFRTMLKPTR